MELFLIRAFQLILSLSILVLIHELGHFLFARLFKVRVEKFYMFFNPAFSIFRAKKIDGKLKFSWFSKNSPASFKEAADKTEFGLGWVPLGGYCAISGMIDESLNTEAMAEPQKPWEFRSKPAGQRLLIMVGGVLFNFILALMIYSAVLNVWGEEYLPVENATMGMDYSPVAKKVGFQDGDRLVSADGVTFEQFNDEAMRLIANAKQVVVMRDTQQVIIRMPQKFMETLITGEQGFAGFRFPTVIKEVSKGSPCAKAGLLTGDSLTAINGTNTVTFPEFVETLGKNKNTSIQLSYYRDGVAKVIKITPDADGKLGFTTCLPEDIFATRVEKFSFFASIPAGIHKGIGKL
ncbi:MAG: site-2 protease family protein, partial [Bacteroidia bacterium]|nr:site-2 protease family protein [Bacteroidia bacterium]